MIDEKKIESSINNILEAIGENPLRTDLKETPKRVSKMYSELFKGINENPKKHLKIFKCNDVKNTIVTVCDIPFYSMCEHHLLPFFGKVSVAYIPKDNKILGISKFSRIVECFSRRLQIQEKLTDQLATFFYENLDSNGVLVIIEAEHLCMTMRGIKSFGAKTKTICAKGDFENNYEKIQEALFLIKENL